MYNRMEYSLNYSDTTGSLWFYFKGEADNFNANVAHTNISNLSSIRLNY